MYVDITRCITVLDSFLDSIRESRTLFLTHTDFTREKKNGQDGRGESLEMHLYSNTICLLLSF